MPRLTLAIALLAAITAAVAAVAAWHVATPAAIATFAAAIAIGGLAICLGVLVARRAPRNPVAGLLALHGFFVVALVTRGLYYDAAAQGELPISGSLVALLRESFVWFYLGVAALLVVFPNGRVPGPRWRALPALMVVVGVAFQLSGTLDPAPFPPPLQALVNPLGGSLPLLFDITGLGGLLGLLAVTVLTAVAMVTKFRRTSSRLERAQLKWLALAGLALPASLIGCLVEFILFGKADWLSLVALLVVIAGVPLAAAIAILRHDLYDVDKAITGVIVYGTATAGLVAIYAAASFAGGLLLGPGSPAAAAAATAACAVALLPLVGVIRRVVDRRLYPLRRAARLAIDDLARRTHAGLARPEELEAVLRVALRDPDLRIGYRVPGLPGFLDAAGATVQGNDGVPVVLGGADIGILLPGAASGAGTPLAEVAADAAVLVEVVRLRLELSAALRDVESSRTRLVQAAHEERRRLERDLHDGAQQRLVSLGMAIRLAQRHLADGTVDVHGLLDQAVAELGTAVAELRRLAHGVRPVGLDDGLREALVTLTQGAPVPVRIEVDADRVPDDLATTAYYVASEAVANAIKHADPRGIDVSVARADGLLRVRVEDDGRGGATRREGAGLAGLADRVEALGGSLSLRSEPGNGTIVEAILPCAS